MEASLYIPKFQEEKLGRRGTATVIYVFLEAESFHLL